MKPRREEYAAFYKGYNAEAVAKKLEAEQGICPCRCGWGMTSLNVFLSRRLAFHERDWKSNGLVDACM